MEDSNDFYPKPEENLTEQQMTGPKGGSYQPPSVLKNGNFLKLWIGQIVSNIGSFFAFIAILFFTLRLSADMGPAEQAQALALVTLIQVIPSVIIGPFSGVIVDRFDRKKIMVVMDIIGAMTSFTMILISQLWQIYAIVSMYSLVRIFFYPAKQAALPMIVDPENIMSANSLSQTTMQLSKIIGPALSGFIVALYGIDFAFILDGVSFVISAFSIMLISIDLKPEPQEDKLSVKSSLRDLKTGFVISWENPVLRYIILAMTLFMVGASLIDPLFAFYLSNEFGLGEEAFGLIISLSAVTGLITAVIVSSKKNIDRKLLLLTSTLLIGGSSIAFIGFAPFLPVPIIALYIGMAVIGSVNVLLMIPLSTLVQTIVETENMGKVNGILGSFLSLTQVGGAAIAGSLVLYYPVSTIYMASGVILVSSFILLVTLMKLFNLEEEAQKQQATMIELKRKELEERKQAEMIKTKQSTDPVATPL